MELRTWGQKRVRQFTVAQRIAKAERNRQATRSLRISALMFLGGRCERCGFNDARAMQFDHVNGDGAKHRREVVGHSSHQLSRAVLKHPERFQVLCANCNWIKRYERNEHAGRLTQQED